MAAATARAIPVFATNGTTLTRFDSLTPGTVTTVAITGLQGGESLIGIDCRPSTGVLYGLSNAARLYTIAPGGAATLVGAGNYPLGGVTTFGIDFNPVDDVLRVISGAFSNLIVNPNNGQLIRSEGSLARSGHGGVAYTNAFLDASTTVMYALDFNDDVLVRIGPTVAYASTFNTGSVETIGPFNLGSGVGQNMGFDIGPDGIALAAMLFGGQTSLYFINLNTGKATSMGLIGNGATQFVGIAIQNGPVTFTNSNTILLPAAGMSGGAGNEKANPYPADIAVSTTTGYVVKKLRLTLHDFRHRYPDDIDLLLESPTGKSMVVWSDVGANISTCGAVCDNAGNQGSTGVTITLDDAAASELPNAAALSSGTFRPTDHSVTAVQESFPAPAPAPPYANPSPTGNATFVSTFAGVAASGAWSLYAIDDGANDTGRIAGGWSLEVTSAPPCQITCPPNVVTGNTPNQCGATIALARPTVNGSCGTLTTTPMESGFFPLGTTVVTTTTSSGSSCSYNVTVNDTQAPSTVCPSNITVQADPGQNATVVNFADGAVGDNCGATVSYKPASGSFFAVGETTVVGTAVDAAGNTATCSFIVTVTPNNATPTPPPPPPTSLANISTRLRVGTGDNVLIGGFIITGSGPKKLMVRALGPSLPIADRLEDPRLELFDSGGQSVASNNNWRDALNEQEIIDSTIPPSNDAEAAILGQLDPGAYTAVVSGVNDGTGVGLVEAYDLSTGGASKLANLATRGLVQTGDDVLIGGFIIVGQDPQRVIVRALGSSLELENKLNDPALELFNGNGDLVGANDNWRSDQESEIVATQIPPSNDLESALVRTLVPDAYTAVVRGVNETTGVAVVEIYAIQ